MTPRTGTEKTIRRRRSPWILRRASSLLLLAACITSGADRPNRPLMHCRILWMHDPARQAVVSWTTPSAGNKHTVHYDTQPRRGRLQTYAWRAEAVHNGRFTMEDDDQGTPEGYYHHALLAGLEPATTYYLAITSDSEVSREFHFVTAPDDDRPVKFLFGGDSRRPPSLPEPHLDRRAMNRRVAALVEEYPDILALAHGGDYCTEAEWRFMRDWLADHELTTTTSGRLLPIIPARGNHDLDVVFEEMFYWPGREHDYYYATALSERAVLLTLNTEISRAGDQRDWLEAELERQRARPDKWILAQYHVPAYGSVKSFQQGESLRRHWVPLFEKYEVDLVCEADQHALKRTVPIYQNRHDPERGLVYIGDGGLGVPQRTPDADRWFLQEPGMTMSAHHVHLLELGPREIRGTAFGMDGKVLDRFTIESERQLVHR